ncbi:MAG: hypothetical protein JO132_04785 [Streptosporangiaceae bacterium]|nr:hypothetical protein [Streptosporangiaceae bacterium]
MASLPVAMTERAPGAADFTAADFTAVHPAGFAAPPRAPDFSAPPPSVSSAADLAATEAFRAQGDPGGSAEPPGSPGPAAVPSGES